MDSTNWSIEFDHHVEMRLLRAEDGNRIDGCGPARRQVACGQRDRDQAGGHDQISDRIRGCHSEEESGHEAGETECEDQPKSNSDSGKDETLPQYHSLYVTAFCAQGHPQSYLSCPQADCVGNHTVNAHDPEDEGNHRSDAQQDHGE